MDYETIRQRYYYDDGLLRYRDDLSPRARKGQVAGSPSSPNGTHPRRSVRYKGKHYRHSRLVYCYFNECGYYDIDGWDIDHLDNDTLNDKIENLLLCEHWENQLNRADTKRNGGVLHPDAVRRRNRRRLKTYHVSKER